MKSTDVSVPVTSLMDATSPTMVTRLLLPLYCSSLVSSSSSSSNHPGVATTTTTTTTVSQQDPLVLGLFWSV